MTNRDNILRLITQVSAGLYVLPGQPHTASRLDADFRTLEKLSDAAMMEFNAIHPGEIDEAFKVKGLHDRLHAVVVQLRAIRHALDVADNAAEKALQAVREIGAAVEESNPDDDAL